MTVIEDEPRRGGNGRFYHNLPIAVRHNLSRSKRGRLWIGDFQMPVRWVDNDMLARVEGLESGERGGGNGRCRLWQRVGAGRYGQIFINSPTVITVIIFFPKSANLLEGLLWLSFAVECLDSPWLNCWW